MFYVLWVLIIVQRIVEIGVARRNEQWMKDRGAYEVGREHYRWFIVVHSLFFLAILVEAPFASLQWSFSSQWLFVLFIMTQAFRIWCLASLGKYWNTKIIVMPGGERVVRGPYRFMKHPNYVIVAVEFVVIPLLFQAYWTALLFPFLHLLLMYIRIPIEEQAIGNVYEERS
ncbi:isoprenylcysteine carboxyl methyltransferase family protein [Pontibacillus litoralis]|nr:isoprenylcysteine carboxylmethyltransferase family protein [Pontibacillus litoralis]